MSTFGKPPYPPEQKTAQDFDYIYNPDGTCAARFDCGKPGVVLAYDDFSPECATWFCSDCWAWQCEDPFLPCFLTIVEDKRPKEEEDIRRFLAILDASESEEERIEKVRLLISGVIQGTLNHIEKARQP